MAKKTEVSIRPLRDRVLVKAETDQEKETTTESGIIIPETVKEDAKGAKKGTVIAVGEGTREDGEVIPVAVKKGDTILFNWGDELELDGEEYHLVNESNILAVLE